MWSNLNTALSDGHGSMSDIFAFVSKNMTAVEAAGDKDKGKGKASEPPKGDGKKEARLAAEAAVLAARPRESAKKSKKEKKSSHKKARRADTSSSSSSSSSESSESESDHQQRDAGGSLSASVTM